LTVVLDDHLLRDWLAGPDRALLRAVGSEALATTNLWYVRLCRSARSHAGGSLLGSWSDDERGALLEALFALPPEVEVVPMRYLAWRMAELGDAHGLSSLGAEAVGASERLDARLLVSRRDDGPGIRAAARASGVGYRTLAR
jgi:hypothetical protein